MIDFAHDRKHIAPENSCFNMSCRTKPSSPWQFQCHKFTKQKHFFQAPSPPNKKRYFTQMYMYGKRCWFYWQIKAYSRHNPPHPPPPPPQHTVCSIEKIFGNNEQTQKFYASFQSKFSFLIQFIFVFSVILCSVWIRGKITPGSRRFPPEMQKRAPKNCHSPQRKSLFNVADLANGMWKVAPENENLIFGSGMNYSKLLF